MRHHLLAGVGLGALLWTATASGLPAPGFVDLFNGRDLTGWVNVNTAPDTWSVRDGVLVCSGRPIGVMRSEKQYENFLLHVEWMHLEPGGVKLNTRDGKVPPIAYVHGELFGVGGVRTVPENPRGERSMSVENRC